MDYRILGPIEVLDGGEPVDIGSRQQRALLAILVLHANRVVATERILEDLWPQDPIGKERTLWVYISRLRSILDPDREGPAKSTVLVTRDHGYVLQVPPVDVDARRFEALADEGRRLLRDDPVSAAAVLREALDLWRGSALEEFRFDDFARPDADRLGDRRLAALEDRIDADLRAGRHREVIGELDELVASHPERERFVGQQMIALYRAGRPADALRAFEQNRRTIGEDLGIEPSPELRRIEEQVLLHDPRLVPAGHDAEPLVSTANPFVGLRPFGEDDADRFFGRDLLIADLVRRLAAGHALVALVGSSGSGKSSALHAGLIAAIRKGAVEGSDDWLIARMVPGSDPFGELEAALSRASFDRPDGLDVLLDDAEDGVLRGCLSLLSEEHNRIVLVIDQFEELFTLGASRSERDRFVRNLEVALGDPDGRIVVVIGLRADFYGHPLEYPVLAHHLAEAIVNVVPLSLDGLEAAAEEPAAGAGVVLEPALLVQLLGDVAGQAGGLPLFQYALTELFDRRDGSLLAHHAYEEMGGVSGVIARRAEDLFLDLDPDERDVAKQLFLRLVTIVDQGAWGRRRVAGGEIAAISPDLVPLQTVLARFSDHRLLTLDRDPVTGSRTVEVAHEALLDQWPRLRRWIDDGRRDVLTRARLSTALTEWNATDRRPGYLLSGQRLADYETWAATSALRLTAAERAFLNESIGQRESDRTAEQQRVQRETKLDRTARRRLRILGAVAAATAIASAVGVIVVDEGDEPSIAVVHGPGGDGGAVDLLIAGVGNVERDRDISVDLLEPLVDVEEDLRRLAETGTELIVVSSEFDLDVDAVAADYPDVHWVAIDEAAVHVEGPNLTKVHFDVQDSAFLAGAAAALSSETGRVGFVGGYQTFRTEQSRNGFEQGARWADPGVDVTSSFLGPVADPIASVESRDDLAFDAATAMYAADVDVIFHDAGPAGRGVARAANEWAGSPHPVWIIGSDSDAYLTLSESDRDVVLTSTIKRFDAAVETVIGAWLDGELLSGDTTLGLADDAVALSRSGDHLAAVDGRLKNLAGDVAFGHIDVSMHAMTPPDWQLDADVIVTLTKSDDGCTVERMTVDGVPVEAHAKQVTVARDDIVEVEMENTSSDIAGLGLRPVPIGTTTDDLLAASGTTTTGKPSQLGKIQAITTAEVGGTTSAAAVVGGQPLSITCITGTPSGTSTDSYPLIVSPT